MQIFYLSIIVVIEIIVNDKVVRIYNYHNHIDVHDSSYHRHINYGGGGLHYIIGNH